MTDKELRPTVQKDSKNIRWWAADEDGGILMDAKYLAEIKARSEAFEKSGENYKVVQPERIMDVLLNDGYSEKWSDLISHARTDIPALLAEVERLTIENLGLKDAAIRCDGYERRYHSALTELVVKDQQIATLKKALKLACNDAADEQCPHEFGLYTCDKCDGCPHDAQCWYNYFIQQAQEQEADDEKV